MDVTIPTELEPFIGSQIESGAYDSPDSVVAALLAEAEAASHALATPEARERIMEGYKASKEGRYSTRTLDDIKRDGRQRLAEIESS